MTQEWAKAQQEKQSPGMGGALSCGPLQECSSNQASADVSTLANDIDRLDGLLHSIGDNLVAVHVTLLGSEPMGDGELPETSGALDGRIAFILRLAEAILQETSVLRRRIG